MIHLREYTKSDYNTIKKWWNDAGKQAPDADMMPEDSSFILELDGVPALSIVLYLTNSKGICYLENFVGNPDVDKQKRKEASKILVNFAYFFAKKAGYKNIIGFSSNEKLTKYYEELGMDPLVTNMTSFIRRN